VVTLEVPEAVPAVLDLVPEPSICAPHGRPRSCTACNRERPATAPRGWSGAGLPSDRYGMRGQDRDAGSPVTPV
jgi:hypothetical protein